MPALRHTLALTMPVSCQCCVLAPVQCMAAASATSTVRISTQHAVAFGEGIKAVGSGAALGEWDPAAAPGAGLHAPTITLAQTF